MELKRSWSSLGIDRKSRTELTVDPDAAGARYQKS